MELSAQNDVDMPADALFDAAADFDRLERMMVRSGAKVRRLAPSAGVPMAWDVHFDWRGRSRDLQMSVTRFDRPDTVEMTGVSDTFDVHVKAHVIALSRGRSRLVLTTEVKPKTLKARLLLQTVRLTRATVERKFADRVAAFVSGLTAARAA